MKKYKCPICGFIYDEAAGIPASGIAPGTVWADLPHDWVCPICRASKASFKEVISKPVSATSLAKTPHEEKLRELTTGELSAVCSNLARGCEKQYQTEASELFTQLADYFKLKTPTEEATDTDEIINLVKHDLSDNYPAANAAAGEKPDRGALRALVWGEKVTRILDSLFTRYKTEGNSFIEHTRVFICETCGFVYVGDEAPDICPVCKVPSWKFAEVERGRS